MAGWPREREQNAIWGIIDRKAWGGKHEAKLFEYKAEMRMKELLEQRSAVHQARRG